MLENKNYKDLFFEQLRRRYFEAGQTQKIYKDMSRQDITNRYIRYVQDDGYLVKNIYHHGFLIIAKGSACPVGVDYMIEDAFVLPTSRNAGWMTLAIRMFITYNVGVYVFRIPKEQEGYVKHWKTLFEQKGYRETKIVNIQNPDKRYNYHRFVK